MIILQSGKDSCYAKDDAEESLTSAPHQGDKWTDRDDARALNPCDEYRRNQASSYWRQDAPDENEYWEEATELVLSDEKKL